MSENYYDEFSYLKKDLKEKFADIGQQLYNKAMIEYKRNTWFSRKPNVPENGIDVSEWNIDKIQQFTEFLDDNNNNNLTIEYVDSIILSGLINDLKKKQEELENLNNDKRYGNFLSKRLWTENDRYQLVLKIEREIEEIKNQIEKEKEKLKNMSGKKGGKSKTKQHYRNKSNKRKSKKSKRKSIKK
jgi:hypothetical protein